MFRRRIPQGWLRTTAGLFIPRPYLGLADVTWDKVDRFAVSSGHCCEEDCTDCISDPTNRQVKVVIPSGNVDEDCDECDQIEGTYYLDWEKFEGTPAACLWVYKDYDCVCECDGQTVDYFYVRFRLQRSGGETCWASVAYGFEYTYIFDHRWESWKYTKLGTSKGQTSFTLPYDSRSVGNCDDPRPCVHTSYPSQVTAEILAAA